MTLFHLCLTFLEPSFHPRWETNYIIRLPTSFLTTIRFPSLTTHSNVYCMQLLLRNHPGSRSKTRNTPNRIVQLQEEDVEEGVTIKSLIGWNCFRSATVYCKIQFLLPMWNCQKTTTIHQHRAPALLDLQSRNEQGTFVGAKNLSEFAPNFV